MAHGGNPFDLEPPESLRNLSPELFEYLRDLNERLTDEHNASQAGAPIFPFAWLTQRYLKQDYPLGSIGRFVHAQYGTLHAIFVKFTQEPSDVVEGVGWKRSTFGSGEVTYNKSESDDLLFAGLDLTTTTGTFGWVMISGITPLPLNLTENAKASQLLKWEGGSSFAPSDDAGVILVANATGDLVCKAGNGTLKVNNTSQAFTGTINGINDQLASMLNQIGTLEGQVATLNEDFSGTIPIASTLLTIQQQLNKVTQSVTILSKTTATFNADSVTARMEGMLAASRNYYNLQQGLGQIIDGQVQEVIIQTNASYDWSLQAKNWSDSSGIYAETSSERAAFASVQAADSELSAQASLTYKDQALAYRDEAGNYYAQTVTLYEAVSEMVGDAGTLTAMIEEEATTRANADSAMASQISTLNAYFVGFTGVTVQAAVTTAANAYVTPLAAVATRTTNLEAYFVGFTGGTVQASITSEATARASGDGALAIRVDNMTVSSGQPISILTSNTDFRIWNNAANPPDGWTVWIGAGLYTRIVSGVGYAIQSTSTGGAESGMYQRSNVVASGWYVLEADAELTSGTWVGGGVLFDTGDSSNQIKFDTEADTAEQISTSAVMRRTWSKLIRVPNTALIALYMMTRWSGFSGTTASRVIVWHKCLIRAASDGEIKAGKALTQAGANTASISAEATTRANADTAMAGQITTLNTTVSGHTSTLTTYGTSISGLQGKYGVSIDTNGYVVGYELNGTGTGGEMTFRVDKFRVAKPGVGTSGYIFDLDANGLKLGVPLYYGSNTLIGESGGNRLRHGAGFGASSNLILWFGPTSVALGAETRTNGAFAMGTDGVVYFGTGPLTPSGTPPRQFINIGASATTTVMTTLYTQQIVAPAGTWSLSGDASTTVTSPSADLYIELVKEDGVTVVPLMHFTANGQSANFGPISTGLSSPEVWTFRIRGQRVGGASGTSANVDGQFFY